MEEEKQYLSHKAELEADRRYSNHEGQASTRRLSDGYERVGIQGEVEFGLQAFQPITAFRNTGKAGDGGVDYFIPLRMSVDVKTYQKPGNLIHEKDKVVADIYVLAECNENTQWEAVLLGWEWGSKLAKAPTKDFGYGIINHYIPRGQLKPMDDLLKRITRVV